MRPEDAPLECVRRELERVTDALHWLTTALEENPTVELTWQAPDVRELAAAACAAELDELPLVCFPELATAPRDQRAEDRTRLPIGVM